MTTTVLDSVNGHDAVDGNPYVPCVIIAGKVANAVSFNGVEGDTSFPYISFAHAADFNQAQSTFSCWLKLTDKSETILIWSKGSDYSLSYNATADRLVGLVDTVPVSADTFGAVPIDTWLLVVLKNDSSGAHTVSIQINNGAADSANNPDAPAGTDDLTIGTSSSISAGHVIIDDLRYFSDLLSAGEITALWAGGAGTAAAVGDEVHWWTFDTLVGGVYPDAAGALDGVLHSLLISSVAGKLSNAVTLTSIDPRNWLSVTDAAELRSNGNDSFSFSFWLKIFAYPSVQAFIIFKAEGVDSDYQMNLYSDGTLGFLIAGSDTAYPEVDIASLPLNQWMMITAIFEYGVGLHLQLNLDSPATTAYLLGNLANSAPGPLIYGQGFNGAIDELYFCKAVLTSDQVIYLYNSGAGRALFP